MNLDGKTLLITGGASGIGRELIYEAIRRGASVAIADRNVEGAEETRESAKRLLQADQRCSVHALDVSDLDRWCAVRQEVLAEHGAVDGLINNAGITFAGSVEDTDYERFESVMAINFMGMVYGCKEFLPLLKERPEAVLANVSSVFGLVPKTSQSAYCSSKYAIRGFTGVLAQELKDTNVTVASVHPGHIGTDIVINAQKSGNVVNGEMSEEYLAVYGQEFKRLGLSPAKAACIILGGLEEGREFIAVGSDARRTALLSRLFPRRYADWFNRRAA